MKRANRTNRANSTKMEEFLNNKSMEATEEHSEKKNKKKKGKKFKLALLFLISCLAAYSYVTDGFLKDFLQGIGLVPMDPVFTLRMVYQYPELPNGCEITTLSMLLNSMGYQADKVDLYLNYLPKDELVEKQGKYYGPSPEDKYVGDAGHANKGWYCYEDVILETADSYFADRHIDNKLIKVSGLSKNDLDSIVKKRKPVMVWTTLDYSPAEKSDSIEWQTPSGEIYVPNRNQHCVMIYGGSNRDYFVANPISGWETVEKDRFMTSFESVGSRAITVK